MNSSKHLVHIVLQVCDSLLSTLILVAPRLSSIHSVSVVLRLSYSWMYPIFGLVVAHEGDSYCLVESSIVHLLLVGLAGHCYYRKHTLLVFSLVISLELNNRRQSLPKLELKDLSSLLYTPIT